MGLQAYPTYQTHIVTPTRDVTPKLLESKYNKNL